MKKEDFNKYGLKEGDKAVLDKDFANSSVVEIVRFTPNHMYATVKFKTEEWQTMTYRLTPYDDLR